MKPGAAVDSHARLHLAHSNCQAVGSTFGMDRNKRPRPVRQKGHRGGVVTKIRPAPSPAEARWCLRLDGRHVDSGIRSQDRPQGLTSLGVD